jgi:hypothetical protein
MWRDEVAECNGKEDTTMGMPDRPTAVTPREEWLPGSTFSASEVDSWPTTLAETPNTWQTQEQQRQDEEELLPEEGEAEDTAARAAVEEWTAGTVRPPLEAEAREWEGEPIDPVSQPPLKSTEEAEAEAKYGI